MKNLDLIQKLVGSSVTAEDLKHVDCYVQEHMGLFIPSTGFCNFATTPNHTHPAYMVIIYFEMDEEKIKESIAMQTKHYEEKSKPSIKLQSNHYFATIMSPDIPHTEIDNRFHHYYCIMIDKAYFESQYAMYLPEIPIFTSEQFQVCNDILKILNLFAFEYSKDMPNSEITLSSQTVLITHWIIRSMQGVSYDMRPISSNYSIARAEHYIEQHYGETLTVSTLANLGNLSVSSFHRMFKKELGITPKEYIIEIRIEKAKKLLRRTNHSLTDIALLCGFSSSAYFSSAFLKSCDISPSQYRKKLPGRFLN